MKKTKIICTVGPASTSRTVLRKMYRAGMNGARINTAYGTMDQYRLIVRNLREVADIPIIVDVKGPEIRIKTTRRRSVNRGDILEVGKTKRIRFSNDVYEDLCVGDFVLIDNGKLRTKIMDTRNHVIKLLATTSGEIDDGNGVNIPHRKLLNPTLTTRDRKIVHFATACNAEFLALSFVRNAQDVNALKKEAVGFKGAVIAKIEDSEGVAKFDEILSVADGIMVARGDLGVEIEPEKVPNVQKSIIRKCNQKGKIVVTATEMLESMTYQPYPTRAEVSDVANAILDGTEATMLSGETAVGRYPVESVSMMSRIASETEKVVQSHVEDEGFINISDTMSRAVQRICAEMSVKKVVTLTRSGYTARMISRFKIPQLIIAITPDRCVKRQLELSYGVYPVLFDYLKEKDRILATGTRLHSMGVIRDEDTVLFTAAFRTSQPHSSNLIEIHNIKELIRLTEK